MNFFHLGLTTVLSTQILWRDSLWIAGELNRITFKIRMKTGWGFLLLLSYNDRSASRRAPSCPQKLTNLARTSSEPRYLGEECRYKPPTEHIQVSSCDLRQIYEYSTKTRFESHTDDTDRVFVDFFDVICSWSRRIPKIILLMGWPFTWSTTLSMFDSSSKSKGERDVWDVIDSAKELIT